MKQKPLTYIFYYWRAFCRGGGGGGVLLSWGAFVRVFFFYPRPIVYDSLFSVNYAKLVNQKMRFQRLGQEENPQFQMFPILICLQF